MSIIKKAKERQKKSRKNSRNEEKLPNTKKYRNYDFTKHHEVLIEFNKKFKEYMNLKYKDGLTFDNILMYSNDKLIKKINSVGYCGNDFHKMLSVYRVLIMEIDEVVGKGDDEKESDEIVDKVVQIEKINNESTGVLFGKSFASHNMAKHWGPTNKNLASEYGMFSNKKAYFLCNDCNHEFESTISNVSRGSWCPYCSSPPSKLCDDIKCNHCFNLSFASHELSIYWHKIKNEKSPREFFKKSNNKCWFICKCGVEFNAILYDVSTGKNWCLCCSISQLCNNNDCKKCFNKSFLSNPKSTFWGKQNKITPRQITHMSGKKFWFKCNCGCEFNATLSSISLNISWCLCCSQNNVCANNDCILCYKKSFASNEKSKYWSKKNDNPARHYTMFSAKKAYFLCNCGHEFESKLSNISANETWCPYCGIHPIKLCEDINCVHCFKLSFASNPRALQWSKLNQKAPREIFCGTPDRYKFDCEICFHTFELALKQIKTQNSWCTYCANCVLCDIESCMICYNKSFACIPKSEFWDEQNILSPRQVFKSSGNKYWFKCDECYHTFESQLASITGQNNWCPYCSHTILCVSDKCNMCINNSFKQNSMAKYWSSKNKEIPRMVFKYSSAKYIFNCPFCNDEYINTVAIVSNGHWCSCTINKTETKLYEYLKIQYNNIIIEKQKKFDFCKNKNHLPFDFCIEQYKVIIELDGDQHFNDNKHFKSNTEERQTIDKHKMIQAKNNGYSIIRIFQPDVWEDKNNWKECLNEAIIQTSQTIGNPIIVYIGKIYKTHYFILD